MLPVTFLGLKQSTLVGMVTSCFHSMCKEESQVVIVIQIGILLYLASLFLSHFVGCMTFNIRS